MPPKNVLLIAESFANEHLVGSTRITNFAKYLPRDCWTVHVIAANNLSDRTSNQSLNMLHKKYADKLLEVDYDESTLDKTKDRLTNKIRRFFCVEASRPWGIFNKMLPVVEHYVEKNEIDVILATTCDLYTLAIAEKVSLKYSIPWVADIRDIWEQHMQSSNRRFSRNLLYIYRSIYRRNHLLKSASSIILANNQVELIKKKTGNKNVYQINNGYDPQSFRIFSKDDLLKETTFKIVYIGKLSASQTKNVGLLFESVNEMLKEKFISTDAISIEFYGTEDYILSIVPDSLKCIVSLKGFVSHIELSDEVYRTAGLFLLFSHAGEVNQVPTKFYEYCTAKKPILCLHGNPELNTYLNLLGNGVVCETKEAIMKYLKMVILEFRENGFTFVDARNEEILNFSRESQTKRLSDILLQCSK